jgi:hypothetical protein
MEEIEFDIKVKEFKGGFFDRGWVRSSLGELGRRALSLFGARVRRYAQFRIKERDRVSQPGEGPTNQTGLLRDFIYFAFSPEAGGGMGGVVIGPAKLGGRKEGPDGPTPKVLEFGGAAVIPQYRRTGRSYRTRYGAVAEREYVGDTIVMIEPRPYMHPAFDDVFSDQMPDIWERAATGRSLPT